MTQEMTQEMTQPSTTGRATDRATDQDRRGQDRREYVVLIVGDADRWWTTMTPEERAHGYAEYARFGQTLAEHGHTVTGGAELHRTSEARHLAPGATVATDGPFAEGVEQVGGFYTVETADLDDLLDCCSILTAIGEGVEVRRTVTDEERQS